MKKVKQNETQEAPATEAQEAQTFIVSNDLTNRLRVFSDWLKDDTGDRFYTDERDGSMERAIKQAQAETLYKIGDLLEEILNAKGETWKSFKDDSNIK